MLNGPDIQSLLNQATVKLAGSSSKAIKAELYTVLDEFFDISSSWQELVKLDALAYQNNYSINVVEGGKIIRLGGVLGNLNFSTNAAFDAQAALHNGTNVGGWVPINAIMPDLGELIILNPPNVPQAMHVHLIKNVKLPTTKDMIPDAPAWVLDVYGRYILDGVLGKMMGTANKSYTNDALSVYHLKKFQEGISRARTAALTKNTYGAQAWSFPQQFKTRSQNGYMSVGSDRSF